MILYLATAVDHGNGKLQTQGGGRHRLMSYHYIGSGDIKRTQSYLLNGFTEKTNRKKKIKRVPLLKKSNGIKRVKLKKKRTTIHCN